ncbi:dihydrofolate reductase isoform X2 [Anabrus simplex]
MDEDWTPIQLDVIAAVDQNMGIGKGQDLPWRIPAEFNYFLNMTSKTKSNAPNRRNAIIIGRKTWETMDSVTSKPFPGALNIVLSRFSPPEPLDYPDTITCGSLDKAVKLLSTDPKYSNIEQAWVIGGAQVYRAALLSPYFRRLYLSRIQAVYPCDIFFPEEFDEDSFIRVSDDRIGDSRVPRGVQMDSKEGVKFEVCVFEKRNIND